MQVGRKKKREKRLERPEKWKMHVNWYNMVYLLLVRIFNIVFCKGMRDTHVIHRLSDTEKVLERYKKIAEPCRQKLKIN